VKEFFCIFRKTDHIKIKEPLEKIDEELKTSWRQIFTNYFDSQHLAPQRALLQILLSNSDNQEAAKFLRENHKDVYISFLDGDTIDSNKAYTAYSEIYTDTHAS